MTDRSWPRSFINGLSAAGALAAALLALMPGGAAEPRPKSKPTGWTLMAAGWWPIARRTYDEFTNDRVLAVSAGVTFYCLLALFPSVSVLVSIYGVFADRSEISAQIASLSAFLPSEVLPIVTDQVARLLAQGDARNILVLATGLLFAAWSSNSGVKSIIEALNVAYGVRESRSFTRLNLVSLAFTAAAIAGLLLMMSAIAVLPVLMAKVMVPPSLVPLLWIGRWPAVFLAVLLALAVLYRFGPSLPESKWRWITPGSLLAGSGLVVFSMLFSWYASNFGHYNETYGALGAVIAFMTWVWLSATIVLMGAELNAELDRRLGLHPALTKRFLNFLR